MGTAPRQRRRSARSLRCGRGEGARLDSRALLDLGVAGRNFAARDAGLSIQPTVTYFGSTTLSMTWMTPLLATMSAFTTLAPSTVTPPVVPKVSSVP